MILKFEEKISTVTDSPQESAVFEEGEVQVFPGLHHRLKKKRRISVSFHCRKVKRINLSMAVAILSKLRHLEPESAQ